MRALPPRRLALGTLCAALLATTTGPAALAADSVPERDRTVSAAALRAQARAADAHPSDLSPVVALVKAVLAADGGQLPPDRARVLGEAARAAVAGAADDDPSTSITMTTVTTATSSSTAQSAAPATTPALTDPAAGLLVPAAGTTGLADEALGAVRETLDGLLDLLLPKDATAATTGQETATAAEEDSVAATDEESAPAQEPTAADDLLTRVDDLLDALLGADPEASAEEPVEASAEEPVEASGGTPTEVTTLPAPVEAAPATSAGTSPATVPALPSLLLPNS
ncbi:hypothetical protein HTV45_09715 [Streptomyces sp. CHD11]|uniref:hypothetical protein n=1 Tax=Streptomyces sp. CHD11 TaxID=2741325 RepID=UPI001BFC1D5D|nr:hypothetical protein [Streptomyces sp. CHD11]MBT3151161.1 hypothetical protein [Streptomyces sp. CHD11]